MRKIINKWTENEARHVVTKIKKHNFHGAFFFMISQKKNPCENFKYTPSVNTG